MDRRKFIGSPNPNQKNLASPRKFAKCAPAEKGANIMDKRKLTQIKALHLHSIAGELAKREHSRRGEVTD